MQDNTAAVAVAMLASARLQLLLAGALPQLLGGDACTSDLCVCFLFYFNLSRRCGVTDIQHVCFMIALVDCGGRGGPVRLQTYTVPNNHHTKHKTAVFFWADGGWTGRRTAGLGAHGGGTGFAPSVNGRRAGDVQMVGAQRPPSFSLFLFFSLSLFLSLFLP